MQIELVSRDRLLHLQIELVSPDRIFDLQTLIRSADRIFDLGIELSLFETSRLILKIKQMSPLGFGK